MKDGIFLFIWEFGRKYKISKAIISSFLALIP